MVGTPFRSGHRNKDSLGFNRLFNSVSVLANSGVEFVPDASGVLFLVAERLLIVADLHLEKG